MSAGGANFGRYLVVTDTTAAFPVRRRTIEADGPIHFADFGGEGRPMVLVHGLGGACENWLAVGGLLAEHARVLAPDLPGFGRTPPAGREITIAASQRALHRFLEAAVGEPAILVGNSMGGLIAMMQAARESASVAGLVLVEVHDDLLAERRGLGLADGCACAPVRVGGIFPACGHQRRVGDVRNEA